MVSYILTLDSHFLIELLWQLLNTLILVGFLSWILYKPVLNFMRKRKEKIVNEIDSANENLGKAQLFKAEYEEKLKNIEREKSEILDNARLQAKQKEEEIIAEAKKEAEIIKRRATLDIQREQEKAKDEMKNQIIEISTLMTKRFISASIDETEQNRLVEEAISGLGDVKWQS